MSEETGVVEDGQEPSMEDILASIRRILSENDEAKIAAVEAELHPEVGQGITRVVGVRDGLFAHDALIDIIELDSNVVIGSLLPVLGARCT